MTPIEAELASEAAKEILSAAHEYTESFQDTVTFGERILKNTPGINRLRDVAIKTLQALLKNKEHRRLAIKIAEDIGSSRTHQINERDVPLADRIALDRQAVLRELAFLDLDQLSPIEVSKIEDLLLKWWLMDKPGTKDATKILRRIKRTPRYRFVKRYISPDYVVDDFEQILKEAPGKDRWTWWWDTYGSQMSEPDVKEMQTLAKQLSEEYESPDQIRAFLTEIDRLISPLNPWPNPPILKFWVDEKPEPFLVLTEPDYWNAIPVRFQGHISNTIVKYNQDYVQGRCREIVEKLPDIPVNELHDFLTMVTVNKIPLDRLKDTFFEIARRGNNLNRGYFIYRLYFYFEPTKDGDSYLAVICEATHDELSKAYCDHLAFSLHVLKKDWYISDNTLLDGLRSKIRPLIKDLKELDYHALEILEFVCGSDLDEYVALIEQRIHVIQAASKETVVRPDFEVLPFEGIPCIKRAISSQEQFNRLMDKIVEWNISDSLGQFDLSHLLESICDIRDNAQLLMVEVWIKSKFAIGNERSFKEATAVMRLIEFGVLDESCYLLLLESGDRLNLFDDAKDVFQWFLDSGLFESRLGEVSFPPLVGQFLTSNKL